MRPTESVRPPLVRPRGLLVVLLAGQFLVNVDLTIVNVAVPAIRTGLAAGDGEIALIVSGYVLVYATLLIAGARLGDVHGYSRLFRVGSALFTFASAACGLAPDTVTLIVARAVQGAGAALLVPQVLSSIQSHFHGSARARALGHYGIALSAGAVAGQALGALLVSADLFGSGWRPVFLVNVPLGAALLVLSVRYLPADTRGPLRSVDLPGIVSLSTALLLALLPLIFGRDLGWPSWTWLSLALAAPAAVFFVLLERRREARGREPLVHRALVTRPEVRWGLVAHGASTLVCLAVLFVLSVYLQLGLGLGAAEAGFASISLVAAFGVSGPLYAHLPDRFAARVPAEACLLVAASCAGLGVAASQGAAQGLVLSTILALLGVGLGLSSVSMIGTITSAAPASRAPDLSGLINANAQLWGAVGIALASSVYFGLAPAGDPGSAGRAFTVVAIGFTVLSIGAGLAARRGSASR